MAGSLTVRALGEADYAEWERLVAGSDQGSLYSHPTYIDTLCRVSNARFTILGALRGTELVGGVVLYERRSALGPYVGPRTLLYYNGLVFRNYDTKYPSQRTSKTLEVMTALEEAIRNGGYGQVVLKNHHSVADVRAFQAHRWQAIPSYTYVVSLENLAEQWTRVEQNLRRLITRCTSQGFQFTDDDDFDEYYRLHVQTVERKQAELYLPYEAFRAYYTRLRSLGFCRLFQARTADGQTASAQMVLLGPYATSHTISAASHQDHLNSGATAFLRWRAFERLAAD